MCRTKPVSKCCCCLDLRMGSSLIAWIGFLWALCALTYSLVEYSLVPVLISLESLFLVLQITLGIGAWRRKQILKRARQKFVQLTKALERAVVIFWLVLQFCFMVVFVVVSVLLVLLTVYRGFKDDILLTIVFVFATGMSIYFWLVVFSFQESLRSKEQEAALRSHPTRSRESEML